MSHYRNVCEYGFVHAQCRCPDPNKTERRVECNNPKEHAAVKTLEKDKINPDHYKSSKSGVECIEITRQMNFSVGNAVKYLWRLGQKDDELTELKKAQWYLRDQLALDEERRVQQSIRAFPEWTAKFKAHIDTVPDGHVKACLSYILNYHSPDPFFENYDYDQIRMLRYAVHEIDVAVLEAEG